MNCWVLTFKRASINKSGSYNALCKANVLTSIALYKMLTTKPKSHKPYITFYTLLMFAIQVCDVRKHIKINIIIWWSKNLRDSGTCFCLLLCVQILKDILDKTRNWQACKYTQWWKSFNISIVMNVFVGSIYTPPLWYFFKHFSFLSNCTHLVAATFDGNFLMRNKRIVWSSWCIFKNCAMLNRQPIPF